jgi:hypothetical protein
MDIAHLKEIQNNEVVRKRLAKKIVRDCFRDGKEFENVHSRSSELTNEEVRAIMIDAVNRTYVFLTKLSTAMGDLTIEQLKEKDDVPNWQNPDDVLDHGN